MKVVVIFLRLVAIAIMLSTLYHKFSGAEESRVLFTELGMEPHGRYLIGSLELIAALLLIIPSSSIYGALLCAGLMSGALLGHVTKLGFAGDRLSLSAMAAIALACSIGIIVIRRNDLPIIKHMFAKAD